MRWVLYKKDEAVFRSRFRQSSREVQCQPVVSSNKNVVAERETKSEMFLFA